MVEREYEYQLKAGRVLVRAVLYGFGALWFAYMALTNDRGLNLYCIPLNQNRATIFYGVFAGLAALFAAYDAANAARRGSLRQRIAFTRDGLSVPRSSDSTEEKQIPYESVLDLKQISEPDNVTVIRHRGGEFTLRLDMLSDERAYAEIVQNLALLVHAAKAEVGGQPPEPPPPKSG
jgi:hypothetical protein